VRDRVGAAVTISLLVAAVPALLTGCSSADRVPGEHPFPTRTPTPVPSAFSTAVPRRDAVLPDELPVVVPPVRVAVPELGIDQTVQPEGVDAAGAMALPEDPAVAGWYRFGAAPASDAGSTVLAAHVDAVGYGVGPFARLATIPVGTTVTVTDGAGRATDYAVVTVDLLAKTGVPWSSVFDHDGPPRLVLVTCGGEFDTGTHHYRSNLVVTATPL